MAQKASTALQGALMFGDLDHRAVYREVRNYLAGQAVGATRDRTLLDELLKVLFCKHFMDQSRSAPAPDVADGDIFDAYVAALAEITRLVPHLFDQESRIALQPRVLAFVHGAIEHLDLDNTRADLVGDAFEYFTGGDARGQEGQFFTPQNAVQLLVDMVDPRPGERVIDPACGAGGFLSAAARRLVEHGAAAPQAVGSVSGIDKDDYLARLAATRLAFISLTEPDVRCADSLAWIDAEGNDVDRREFEGQFDAVLTNPPFGSKIVAASRSIQQGFDLGYRWKLDPAHEQFERTETLQTSVPPQVLFIERCISLVRPGGRIGIVVPESLISGRNYRHVVAWTRERASIQAVVGMPEALFKTSGKGGTHTKVCLVLLERTEKKVKASKSTVFMAEARWCGNDSRGRATGRDELPTITERWRLARRGRLKQADHLGYRVPTSAIVDDILAPRYYNPEVALELEALAATHELVSIESLVGAGVLEIKTGHEVGAAEYGTGTIPFVRTSDISNWELKLDPKHGVSDEVYQRFAPKQDVREGDLLMVRDGTYLVGTCAYVTKYDTKIVFQSHLYKLRILEPDALSPYLLLAALSSAPVRRQIRAKRFTQDIIDSLGSRVNELVLPLPKNDADRERVEDMVRRSIDERVEARELARQACFEIIGRITEDDEPEL